MIIHYDLSLRCGQASEYPTPWPAAITTENLKPQENLQRVITLAESISCLTEQTARLSLIRRFLRKTHRLRYFLHRVYFLCFDFSTLHRDAAVLFSLTSMLALAFIIH